METILCRYTEGKGWRVAGVGAPCAAVKVVEVKGVKLISVPALRVYRNGTICNPAKLAVAVVRSRYGIPVAPAKVKQTRKLHLRLTSPDGREARELTVGQLHVLEPLLQDLLSHPEMQQHALLRLQQAGVPPHFKSLH